MHGAVFFDEYYLSSRGSIASPDENISLKSCLYLYTHLHWLYFAR